MPAVGPRGIKWKQVQIYLKKICPHAGGGVDVRLDKQLSLDFAYCYYGLVDLSSKGGTGSVDIWRDLQ